MKRGRPISRQLSVFALVLISVTALLLASGIVVYSGDPHMTSVPSSVGTTHETIPDGALPLEAPSAADGAAPDTSAAVVGGSILIALTFVFVWFLVFRPLDPSGVGGPVEKDHAPAKDR